MELPKHMDIASRNQRLRETLEGMGLVVVPIYSESDPSRIDYMHVSVDLPSYVRQGVAEQSTSSSVAKVMPSSDVGRDIEPTERFGGNVVNLPSVR
jgi:hypothetical protein